jgi:hypothetical protein
MFSLLRASHASHNKAVLDANHPPTSRANPSAAMEEIESLRKQLLAAEGRALEEQRRREEEQRRREEEQRRREEAEERAGASLPSTLAQYLEICHSLSLATKVVTDLYCDAEPRNVLYNEGTGRCMIVDLMLSEFYARQPHGPINVNGRNRKRKWAPRKHGEDVFVAESQFLRASLA